MGKTRGERREFWRQHVRAWRQSDQRRAAYCAEHGLNPQTFNVWVGRLRDEFRPAGAGKGRSAERMGSREETDAEPATFVPVELAEETPSESSDPQSSAPIEVDAGGVTVRVPAEADAEVLTRVITAARRAP